MPGQPAPAGSRLPGPPLSNSDPFFVFMFCFGFHSMLNGVRLMMIAKPRLELICAHVELGCLIGCGADGPNDAILAQGSWVFFSL